VVLLWTLAPAAPTGPTAVIVAKNRIAFCPWADLRYVKPELTEVQFSLALLIGVRKMMYLALEWRSSHGRY